MKLKDCLTHDGASARNAEGIVVNRDALAWESEGWEPLMTEAEWRDKYMDGMAKNVWRIYDSTAASDAGHERLAAKLEPVYGPRPKPIEKVGTVPIATNPVGERLTEAPEVGTWVMEFINPCFAWLIKYQKGNVHKNAYRWLGPVPIEPKEPEKIEPPKWLADSIGSVIYKANGERMWVRDFERHFVTLCRELEYPNHSIMLCSEVSPDPSNPPSPELAKLFGERGGP